MHLHAAGRRPAPADGAPRDGLVVAARHRQCHSGPRQDLGRLRQLALVREDARVFGFDDAIVLNEEGGRGVGGQPHARSRRDADHAGHHGRHSRRITRRSLLQLARDMDLPVEERADRTELYLADEIFLCGTGAQLAPVVSVDRRPAPDSQADRDDIAAPLHGHRRAGAAAPAGRRRCVVPPRGRRSGHGLGIGDGSRCRPRRPATVCVSPTRSSQAASC